MTKVIPKKSNPKRVSIVLEGDNKERFEMVQQSIESKAQGIKVDNPSVIAHALFLACEYLEYKSRGGESK